MMPPSDVEVQAAVAALRRGDVIGLPTETVYGLAADGTNPEAVRKIFAIKGRPVDHPLILHLGDASWLDRYTVKAPQAAYLLAEAFWPGPLSLVLPRSDVVPDEVTGGLATVAVRVPSHPVALRVLHELNRPLAAPSANRFGKVSPTTKAHVERDLGAQLPLVLDGGACEVGVESTIVNLTGDEATILRPGGVSAEQLRAVLGYFPGYDDETAPAAPGTLDAHYAPRAEVLLMIEEEVWEVAEECLRDGKKVGTFCIGAPPDSLAGSVVHRGMGNVREVAHDLYAVLRDLDAAGCDVILAAPPLGEGLAEAINDRLQRASVGSRRTVQVAFPRSGAKFS